ncbi:DNA polymerase III PolC-type [Clostridia bacterium]|nr:DNA polymerase III PolC-type [Clostridia bacterium]
MVNYEMSNFILDKKAKTLSLDVTSDEFSNDKAKDLETEFLKKYPFLKKVFVNFSFGGGDIDLYWDALIRELAEKNVLCAQALGESKHEFADGTLKIYVPKSLTPFLTRLKIADELSLLIQLRLKLTVTVLFEEDEEAVFSEKPFYSYIKEEAQKELKPITYSPPAALSVQKWNGNGYNGKGGRKSGLKLSDTIAGEVTPLSAQFEADDKVIIDALVFKREIREAKNNGTLIYILSLTDGTGSVTAKFFTTKENAHEFDALCGEGKSVRAKGKTQFDDYSKEINVLVDEIAKGTYVKASRQDNYEGKKRVELHLHTKMSKMDAINGAEEYFSRAKEWGHTALAITDHGVVQAFPESYTASKKTGVRAIFGTEAYIIDDLGVICTLPKDKDLNADFVVFDVETTGLSSAKDRVIEIGAVKIQNGEITGHFSEFVKIQFHIPEKITELTSITDDMIKDADTAEAVIPRFLEFVGSAVAVAHNAAFDMGFISAEASRLNLRFANSSLCTVELSRTLLKDLSNHKLDTICAHLGVDLAHHHRAVDDAEATALVFLKLRETLLSRGVTTLANINALAANEIDKKKLKRYYHAVILVKNQTGLRNLYELVSESHVNYFLKRPRIPKSLFSRLREGLIIGTACEAGELYKAVLENKPEETIESLCDYYDYLEIQPIGNNAFLIRDEQVTDEAALREINKRIVNYGVRFNKPVVATCDTHFIDPEDEVFRRVLMAGSGFKDADKQAPLYFRTTEEMLSEFSYLGEEKAFEVVVTNTNLIADMCEAVKPIPEGTFPPQIEGAERDVEEIARNTARAKYGGNLPEIVSERLNKELTSIIKNGFSVMYVVAQKLVKNSMENGYLVGSRGSVGSSFVATMTDITEVNPLSPHYYCESCKYTDFDSEIVKSFAGASGCDMPDKNCPVCGAKLKKDGHDIPFETFLGFDGDKEPDIDLNFSGEYQAKAHAFTEELFGKDYVFKVGTIGTLAEKTAFGYVKKYAEERNMKFSNAEMGRLAAGLTGIKRTTGQHPGGLLVVPKGHSIYEFSPVQHPADDTHSDVLTTHYDYDFIHGALLKFDILGHDVPTIIRMLHDFTGVNPVNVDLGDADVMSLFTSPQKLGVTAEEIDCKTGTLGLPEFGTTFVRQMLMDTKPSSFAELVRISGLSHGTDVWFNNAQTLIKDGTATLKEVIPTRDDIMVYLINKGVAKKSAFKIMENVRKGKGLTEEEEKTIREANVPEWYINSCKKIKYMFPKGHAVAYVMMTVRIGWFKIHYPEAFYAASFSIKVDDFDYVTMCKGAETAKTELKRIISLGKDATAKEKNTQTTLELVLEMYARNISFAPLDLYKSDASRFTITDDKRLLPPLCAVAGLGETAAVALAAAREDGEFATIEDLKNRSKITKPVVELLKANGVLKGIPEDDQISLFNMFEM